MTYMGKVQGGAVVFDGDEKPQEGSIVRVETVEANLDDRPIGQKLLELAGIVKDGPADGSVNVDHYLYGLPKK
jgi:hypothetical protein